VRGNGLNLWGLIEAMPASNCYCFECDPWLGQPLLSAKREDSHDNLFVPVPIGPSELDVSPFGLIIVLCLAQQSCSARHW